MKIEPTLNSTSFAEAANGSVLLTTIREREIVQGVKVMKFQTWEAHSWRV